jgi:predicted PurR-regulated permease PerM
MGGVIGTVLGFTLKLCNPAIGLDVNIWIFTLILIAIFFFAQLIDNVVYQPVIYSSSIKSTPPEIFIVLLIAGNIGGFIGMLIAIPSYTVIRVVAGTFFRHVKFIRILIPIESIDKTE